MKIIDLTGEQVGEIEERLEEYDEKHITYKMDGFIRIGMEENGELIAGLDACVTTFKILYVSTLFVDEKYRRKGIAKQLILEMEKRAKKIGVNTVRLDTFDWQGKEFYEALGYECVGHYENAEDGYAEYFYRKSLA